MSKYSYMPIRVPLSGASFESQTTALFESLSRDSETKFSELTLMFRNMQNQLGAMIQTVEKWNNMIQQLQDKRDSLVRRVEYLERELIFVIDK